MADTNDAKYPLYLGVRKKSRSLRPHDFSSSLSQIESWAKEPDGKAPETAESDEQSGVTEGGSDGLSKYMEDLIYRFSQSMSGFIALANLSTGFPIAMDWAFTKNRLQKNAGENYRIVAESEYATIYGITESQQVQFIRMIQEHTEMLRGFSVLPAATILSMVAVYDSYTVDLIKALLKERPDRYAHPDKKIPVKDVLSMSSFNEVIESVIDSEIDTVMRGSHIDQVAYLEATFNIEIRKGYKRWGRFVELFERRNVVAHGNSIANAAYVRNCVSNGFFVDVKRIGKSLPLNGAYIESSVDLLTEFGLLTFFSLWKKNVPKDLERIFLSLHYATYEMIERKRYKLAAVVLDYLLELKVKISDRTYRMMTINRANAHKKMGDGAWRKIVGKLDWGAVSPEFSICIAALNEDVDEFVDLMSPVHSTGKVSESDFTSWPVFDWVRDAPRVKTKFEEMFGAEVGEGKISKLDDMRPSDLH